MIPITSRVDWPRTFRLVRSIYPPVDLFEDIADPADWEPIVAAEAKTDLRMRDQVGAIQLVPPQRRVSGPGATRAMAPFCHVSLDRPSRFSDGTYGVYYAGDRLEVALAETLYHFQRFMSATDEEPSIADYRELVGRLEADFHDLRGPPAFGTELDADDYAAAQSLARMLRNDHASNGIVYPSVRDPAGEAVAVFWPDIVGIPVPGRRICYRWDGHRADAWLMYGDDHWHSLP